MGTSWVDIRRFAPARVGGGLVGVIACGCADVGPPRDLPHVPEGTAERPSVVVVAMPAPGHTLATVLAASRDEWSGLADEARSLSEPARFPQPEIPDVFRARGVEALRDLVDPLWGVTAHAPVTSAEVNGTARTLIVVEMLPGELIQAMHGSDAFTESFYELDTLGIRRAVIRLPLWLLDESPDDFANFLQHEFGHALGLEGHLEEGLDLVGDTWFWDRLMTVPTPIGQRWQPATSEDIAALASGRYRLREGWSDSRTPRYRHLIPYRSEPIRVAAH